MDVAAWLRGLGLERYVPAFRDNEIDWEALPKLTAEDLKDLGVVLGGHPPQAPGRHHCARRRGARGRGSDVPRRPGTGRCRTPAADSDVLRPGRVDCALVASGSRGFARGHRRVSPRRHRDRCRGSMGSSPGTWATAYWSISATRKRMRTTPSVRCGRGWARSTPSVTSRSNPSSCALGGFAMPAVFGALPAAESLCAAKEGAHARGVNPSTRRLGAPTASADDLRGRALDRLDLPRVA
jgi:hypothetical protein